MCMLGISVYGGGREKSVCVSMCSNRTQVQCNLHAHVHVHAVVPC